VMSVAITLAEGNSSAILLYMSDVFLIAPSLTYIAHIPVPVPISRIFYHM
jgi:hypothetical protein